jgi:hypothetical protein
MWGTKARMSSIDSQTLSVTHGRRDCNSDYTDEISPYTHLSSDPSAHLHIPSQARRWCPSAAPRLRKIPTIAATTHSFSTARMMPYSNVTKFSFGPSIRVAEDGSGHCCGSSDAVVDTVFVDGLVNDRKMVRCMRDKPYGRRRAL